MGRPRKNWAPKLTAATRTITRVAGYVRVSTNEQADSGFGLAVQRQAIEDYARAAGYELVQIYEDAGLSGSLPVAERPALAALLAAVDAGELDAVIVKSSDRFARSLAVSVDVYRRLDAAGIKYISITEPGLSAGLMRGILATIADDERTRILERTSTGRRQKASTGAYAGGGVPYGYKLVGSRKTATWELDEPAAATVRRVFELRASGLTYAGVMDSLNAAGVPAPRGGKWLIRSVFNLLNNPAYTGQRRWREGSEYLAAGEHPAIITAECFQDGGRETAA